jgi:FAD/FMN-containing dehydrogenase
MTGCAAPPRHEIPHRNREGRMRAPDASLIQRFVKIVGPAHALTPPADLTRYEQENRHVYKGRTPLVLRPGSTAQVAAILRLAQETGTAVVPQGGHTGHVAAGAPDESGTQIVVSLERMNAIRDIDLKGNTITVEAGVVLQAVQEAAARHDRLFPVALGSQGSCQIGGNISTNAGGNGVLAHGNMREQVLGLEVALPGGEIWNGLRRLKKDNTGYSLRDLFIGAEGTLGIVTAAVLKLQPAAKGHATALIGVSSPQAALSLFSIAMEHAGRSLTAFELMPRIGIEFVLRHAENSRDLMQEPHSWYVLAEISSSRSQEDAATLLASILADGFEGAIVEDAAVAASEAQRREIWKIREDLPPCQAPEGGSIKHDISVPVHLVPQFMERADAAVMAAMEDARIVAFGHMGDGNIHYNISQPAGGDTAAFLARREEINALVHAIVADMEGSVAAEHGVGRMKRDLIAATKSPVELALMRSIKKAIDPTGIMNPGKVL